MCFRFVSCGSTFVRGLALGSVQFGGVVKSAGLPELSPNLQPPKPPVKLNEEGKNVQACVTLSAGRGFKVLFETFILFAKNSNFNVQ